MAGTKKQRNIWKAAIEISSIVFLFYSNLLMGEFERSAKGHKMGLAWAIGDIFTPANFVIAVIAALTAYVVFESLRERL